MFSALTFVKLQESLFTGLDYRLAGDLLVDAKGCSLIDEKTFGFGTFKNYRCGLIERARIRGGIYTLRLGAMTSAICFRGLLRTIYCTFGRIISGHANGAIGHSILFFVVKS